MYVLSLHDLERLLQSVQAAFPREASGLLLRRDFRRFAFLSLAVTSSKENTPLSFRITDADIEKTAKSLGNSNTICGCFHSHVVGAARPSHRDCAATKKAGDLWLIYSMRFRHLNLFEWDGTKFKKDRFQIVSWSC